eukprot:scaffold114535_cov60-Phaeocystis_antarctica.AAC.2
MPPARWPSTKAACMLVAASGRPAVVAASGRPAAPLRRCRVAAAAAVVYRRPRRRDRERSLAVKRVFLAARTLPTDKHEYLATLES